MKRFSQTCVATLLGMMLGQPGTPAELGTGAPRFTYDDSSEALVVSFREVFPELAEQDPIPLIRIFGDGRVLVHFPRGSARAGDHELRLEGSELDALLGSLVAKGLVTFDPPAVDGQKRSEQARRRREAVERGEAPTFVIVADDVVSVFELDLKSYRPAGPPGVTLAGIRRQISWQGLATDAANFEEIEGIQKLYAAELELRALLSREALVPVQRVEER